MNNISSFDDFFKDEDEDSSHIVIDTANKITKSSPEKAIELCEYFLTRRPNIYFKIMKGRRDALDKFLKASYPKNKTVANVIEWFNTYGKFVADESICDEFMYSDEDSIVGRLNFYDALKVYDSVDFQYVNWLNILSRKAYQIDQLKILYYDRANEFYDKYSFSYWSSMRRISHTSFNSMYDNFKLHLHNDDKFEAFVEKYSFFRFFLENLENFHYTSGFNSNKDGAWRREILEMPAEEAYRLYFYMYHNDKLYENFNPQILHNNPRKFTKRDALNAVATVFKDRFEHLANTIMNDDAEEPTFNARMKVYKRIYFYTKECLNDPNKLKKYSGYANQFKFITQFIEMSLKYGMFNSSEYAFLKAEILSQAI